MLNNLITHLSENFKKAKILIVGDLMLDKYWFGDTNRISPEAPIPITKINTTEYRIGGAGNVARNIAHLQGQAILLSIIGEDESGDKLTKLINKENISPCLISSNKIRTTEKLRVISRNQQLIGLDFEDYPSNDILKQIEKKYASIIDLADIIIFSDYNKGCLDNIKTMIEIAHSKNKIILIDPKGSDYSIYKNANIITPNKTELMNVIGSWQNEKELYDKTQKLRKKFNIDNILLTRSEEGLTLFNDNGFINKTTKIKEVYDVSGAGDTIIATIALCIASKINLDLAMEIANIAAGIVIAKIGTATCSFDELLTNNYFKELHIGK